MAGRQEPLWRRKKPLCLAPRPRDRGWDPNVPGVRSVKWGLGRVPPVRGGLGQTRGRGVVRSAAGGDEVTMGIDRGAGARQAPVWMRTFIRVVTFVTDGVQAACQDAETSQEDKGHREHERGGRNVKGGQWGGPVLGARVTPYACTYTCRRPGACRSQTSEQGLPTNPPTVGQRPAQGDQVPSVRIPRADVHRGQAGSWGGLCLQRC